MQLYLPYMSFNSICIFGGSSTGDNEVYRNAASVLGQLIAERGMKLIYGGAKVGLMGTVANSVLENGGEVIGIIPEFLHTKEVAHTGLTQLITVDTMHERKLKMHELSDAIITLPGGWGTMEEMFEMLTWGQLGLHHKPIGLLNINGYYNCLHQLIDTMMNEGFLKEYYRELLLTHEEPETLLQMLQDYTPPALPQWITEKTT